MHEALVKSLKVCADPKTDTCDGCSFYIHNSCHSHGALLTQAAYAIEELEAQIAQIKEVLGVED